MSRWLLVTADLPPTFTGGVASWVDDMAQALVAGGHGVTVLARAGRGAQTAPEAAWGQARPYSVRRIWGRSWARWGARWVDLSGRDLLSTVDQVLFSTWPLARLLGPRCRGRGLPVGIAFHGSDLTRVATPDAAMNTALGCATALLPVSHFLGRELQRLGARSTAVLPMPLQIPEPNPGDDAPERHGLVCVARLTSLKGVDRSIALAQALGLPLTVIGDGPQTQALRSQSPAGVQFLGRLDRDATCACYARSQACLLLSRADADGSGAEGLGLTLLEAQAHGAVAIGSATGGIPEAVGPGLVITDPESPDLDAVRALLNDASAGPTARAWVQQHHGPDRARAVLDAALHPQREQTRDPRQ